MAPAAASHQTQCFDAAIETAIANAIIRPSPSTIETAAADTRCQPKKSTSPEIEEQPFRSNEQNKAT
jgi:hypothetical protein